MNQPTHPRLKSMARRQAHMLDLLERLVNTDSPSTVPVQTTKISRMVGKTCEELGAEVSYVPAQSAGDHMKAVWNPQKSSKKSVLILCHLDTVWPEGEAQRRPFRVVADRATGPGVADMKGGVVQALYGIESLLSDDQMPDRPVVLLCNTDEETGSQTSREAIESLARQSSCVLVLESSAPPDGPLKTARKGVGRFTVRTYGRASHAGGAHQQGINAIEEMARHIQNLHALTDYDRGTTVNVGVIDGGSRPNVVPAQCEVEVDLRVSTLEEADRMQRLILGLEPVMPGARIEARGGLNRPPMQRTAAIASLFAVAQRVGRELGLEITEGSGGGGSDGNLTAALGVPTLDSLGPVGSGEHALDEWLSVRTLVERTALLAELLRVL